MTTNTKTKEITEVRSLVLCHYQTTAPGTTTLNRSASARAIADAKAAAGAARTYNTIITARGTAVGRAISLQQRTGVSLRRLGLPCPTGGCYLRVRDITTAQNIFDDAMAELDTIRTDILATYPDLVVGLRARLGGFANEVEIPTATEVASRFTMHMSIIHQPMAVDNNVLRGLTAEVSNRVRAESQGQINSMLRQAHAGPVEDLKRVLAEFSDRMRNAERLHLTQFDKLRAEAVRLRDLNVLDLPEINEITELATALCSAPGGVPEHEERVEYANRADKVSAKADETLASIGLG